jgi:hypothetical protein
LIIFQVVWLILNAGLARAALPVIRPQTYNAPNFYAPQFAKETPDTATSYVNSNPITCTTGPQTKTFIGLWNGVASDYIAGQLTVRWYATSAFTLGQATGDVAMTIEYSLDNGSSFNVLEQFTANGPDGNHNFGTQTDTVQTTLPAGQDASTVQVKSTLAVRLLTCPGQTTNGLTGALYVGDIAIQTGPPVLDGPSSITRADSGTFTVRGAPGGTKSAWYFSPTLDIGTVNRATGTGNATWSGTIVADGTAHVHVAYARTEYDLTKAVIVNARPN